jgi:hypothetical protein
VPLSITILRCYPHKSMDRLRSLLSRLSLVGTLLVAASAVAGAAPCVTASLQSYINSDLSGGCSQEDRFFRFDFSSQVLSGDPVIATASQILVTPMSTATSEGFSFSAMVDGVNHFSTPSGSVSYQISYTIDPATTGADMSLDPPFGDVRATQSYCLNDVLPACAHGQQLSQTVSTANSPVSLDSHVNFPIAVSNLALVDVTTVITLNGPAGFDALNTSFSTTPQVAAVPEPSAALLALCGLPVLLLAGAVRRQLSTR